MLAPIFHHCNLTKEKVSVMQLYKIFFYGKHHQKLPVAFVPNYSVNCQSLNFLADDSGSVEFFRTA